MLNVSIIGFYIAAEPGDCNQDQSLSVPGNLGTPGWKKPLSLPRPPAACVPPAGRGWAGAALSFKGTGCPEPSHLVAFSGDAQHGTASFPRHTALGRGKTQPLRDPREQQAALQAQGSPDPRTPRVRPAALGPPARRSRGAPRGRRALGQQPLSFSPARWFDGTAKAEWP